MSEILAEVWVPGRPRPKGSMRCMGKGHHMEEDNPDSKPWRIMMARALVADRDRRRIQQDARCAYPHEVDVSIVAFFPERGPTPGDVDKLARNVLDALQDSVSGSPAVLADDAQVVGLLSERTWVDDEVLQGIWIRVTTVDGGEVSRRKMLRNQACGHFLAQQAKHGEATGF